MNLTTCPHGNHVADIVPHPTLLRVCSVCGGPRLPSDAAAPDEALGALRAAREAHVRLLSSRFGSGCSGAAALLFAVPGLALLRLDSGWAKATAFAFLGLAAPFLVGSLVGLLRGRSASRARAAALAAAWRASGNDADPRPSDS